MANYFASSTGLTGKSFEEDLLFANTLAVRHPKEISYKNLRDSIDECINNNLNNFSVRGGRPPSPWVKELYARVRKELGLPMDSISYLTLIPALGTAADQYHGIDFFMVYSDPKTGQKALLTFDASLRKQAESKSLKADILVTDTGAKANENYYSFRETDIDIADEEGESREEYLQKKKERMTALVRTTVELLKQKLTADPHYTSEIYHVLNRGRIAELLNPSKKKDK